MSSDDVCMTQMADPNETGHTIHRLDAEFTRHLEEYQRTRDDVLRCNNELQNLKSAVQANTTKLEEKSKLNLPAITLAVMVLPGVWFLVKTYTESVTTQIAATANLNSQAVEHLKNTIAAMEPEIAANTSANVTSRADRQQINDRTRTLETTVAGEIADRRSASAAAKVNQAVTDSQIHAISNLENLRAAMQERLNTLLWEKTRPGERYPNSTFFPTTIFNESNPGPGATP